MQNYQEGYKILLIKEDSNIFLMKTKFKNALQNFDSFYKDYKLDTFSKALEKNF